MNQSVSALGSAVRETRKSRHLSQKALAEKVGVCKRTIIDIEKNEGNPKFEVLCKLIRELDLPIYQVFYPEIDPNMEPKDVLMQELGDCTEHELEIIIAVIKGLKASLKREAGGI